MVSRQEDIGSTTTPLTMLMMAPYFLVIFFNDNPVVLGGHVVRAVLGTRGHADAPLPR